MALNEKDPVYALGRADAEHQRLTQQAALLRPLTERLFLAAGLKPGMRVLDVGSGAGDVALLAASIVGPQGEVVGIDLDGNALEKARARVELLGLSNVRFIQGDIRTAALPDDFDAAVGRLVLMYFAEPSEALRAVASHVRTGGPIAFQEMIMDPAGASQAGSYPSDSLWSTIGLTIFRTFAAAGVHVQMGWQLLQAYKAAGLPIPSVSYEGFAGGGPDFAGYAWLANTMTSLAPLSEKVGLTKVSDLGLDTLQQRLRDDAVARNLLILSPPFVGAFATRP